MVCSFRLFIVSFIRSGNRGPETLVESTHASDSRNSSFLDGHIRIARYRQSPGATISTVATTTSTNSEISTFPPIMVENAPVVATVGLSESDKIAFGVGLGIGLPACLVIILWTLVQQM